MTVILIIKIIHSIIFLALSACILFLVYCAIFDKRNKWTLIAFILVAIEGIVIVFSGWKCPLAELATRLGAKTGSVTQLFLPKFLAGRVFEVCTPLASIAILVLGIREGIDLWRKHHGHGGGKAGGSAHEAGAGVKKG